jgi:hypothetical protein
MSNYSCELSILGYTSRYRCYLAAPDGNFSSHVRTTYSKWVFFISGGNFPLQVNTSQQPIPGRYLLFQVGTAHSKWNCSYIEEILIQSESFPLLVEASFVARSLRMAPYIKEELLQYGDIVSCLLQCKHRPIQKLIKSH